MSVECFPITVLPHVSQIYRDYLTMGDKPADAAVRRWYGSEPFAGKCMVVSLFAKALYQVTGLRPAVADFDQRRDRQQYELRVKRMDIEFDHKLGKLYEDAVSKGLWQGTAAARDRVDYWAAGVEAYFDAAGDGEPPSRADRPITTRELLKAYDPALYTLVDETMGYKDHVDWRFKR